MQANLYAATRDFLHRDAEGVCISTATAPAFHWLVSHHTSYPMTTADIDAVVRSALQALAFMREWQPTENTDSLI